VDAGSIERTSPLSIIHLILLGFVLLTYTANGPHSVVVPFEFALQIPSMIRMPPRLQVTFTRHVRRQFSTTPRLGADHVRIVEVGPRDGLQNEKSTISLETRIELIERLAKTGITHMEAGSFVPAKWVPQVGRSSRTLSHIQGTRHWGRMLSSSDGFNPRSLSEHNISSA